jgi:hypothetical protein
MDLQVSRLDIKKTAQNWPVGVPFQPAILIKQPTVHPLDWWIADSQVVPGEPPNWVSARQDQYVRIPLFSYDLSPEADLALAYMVQLGLSCAGYLPGRVKKFHVVTGNPVDLLYDDAINKSVGLRYWFGLAVVTDKGV